MFSRSRDTVQLFGAKRCFTLVRKSEVIFVELMGPTYTRPERFPRGVAEHPRHDSCAEGAPGGRAKGGFCTGYCMSILDIWVSCDL